MPSHGRSWRSSRLRDDLTLATARLNSLCKVKEKGRHLHAGLKLRTEDESVALWCCYSNFPRVKKFISLSTSLRS